MNKAYCVHCGKEVSEFATLCPFCKKPVANPHAPTEVSPEPKTWKKTSYAKKAPVGILIACAMVVIAAVVVYLVKFSG